MGLSSNYINNNLETFGLLIFLFLKFLLFKWIFSFTKTLKRGLFGDLTFFRFFHQFIAELAGFCPFMIVAAVEVFLNMAEESFSGKINSILHVVTVFSIANIFIVGYCLNRMEITKYRKKFCKKKNATRLNLMKARFNVIENN